MQSGRTSGAAHTKPCPKLVFKMMARAAHFAASSTLAGKVDAALATSRSRHAPAPVGWAYQTERSHLGPQLALHSDRRSDHNAASCPPDRPSSPSTRRLALMVLYDPSSNKGLS